MKCILVLDKHTGSLSGFTDLGDVCNLLAEYEQQQSGGDSTTSLSCSKMHGSLYGTGFNSLPPVPKDVIYLFCFGR